MGTGGRGLKGNEKNTHASIRQDSNLRSQLLSGLYLHMFTRHPLDTVL